jgi:hypothetical protein
LLRSGLLLGVGGVSQALAGCTSLGSPPPASTTSPLGTSSDSTPTGGETPVTGPILLAYFSRPGENYYYGGRRDLEVGNTEVLAVSGLGSTERVYTEACAGAEISPGLAVQGEEITQHRDDIETWLRQNGLLST